MSTLKTHNLQSPDAGSVNIVMAPNAGMVVAGLSTYSNQINVGNNIKLGNAGVVTATSFVGSSGLNVLDGRVKIGTTSNTPASANEPGIVFGDNTAGTATKGIASFCANGAAPLLLTRRVSDGNVLGIADDTTTRGMLRVTSNDLEITAIEELRLSTGAGHNEKIRLTNAGRFGLGVTGPDAMLHVKGSDNVLGVFESTDADSLIQFKDNSTSDTILMGALGGDDLLLRCDAGNIVFHVANNNEKLRIQADGDVSFSDSATGAAQIKSVSGDQADRNNGGYPQYAFVGNEGTGMRRPSSNVLAFDSTGAERFRIDSTGRFLKGLTSAGASRSSTSVRYPHFQLSSPWSSGLGSYKIECTDDYPIIFLDSNASYANNSGAGVVTWSVKDSSGDYCNTASILSKIDATPSNDSAPGRLEFHTTTSGSTPTTKMTIDSGGSVLKPLNPAFYANNLSNNAVYTAGTVIPWPNTNVDTRSAFATSGSDIGRYTIPTTGIYFFGWRLNRLGDSRFDLAIYVNGSIKYYDELRSDHGSGIWQAESGHYIFNCTAGQKIDLRIASVANAGSGQFDGGQLYDAFFGWMIG